jgi:hypothetical protein
MWGTISLAATSNVFGSVSEMLWTIALCCMRLKEVILGKGHLRVHLHRFSSRICISL